jgi:exopolysaccharide biosynthesis polyprenyl glycosylphosphotransferase
MTTQFSSSDPEIQEAAAVTGTFPLTATAAVSGDAWYGSFRRQLVLADTLIVGAAVGASAVLTFGDSPESLVSGTPVPYPLAIFLIGAIWLLCLSAKESRDRHVVGAGLMEYERVFNASLWAFGAIAVLSYLGGADLSRMLFVATLPLGVTLLVLGRWALRARLKRKRRNGAAMTPTLIVGTPRDVERLRLDMNRRRDAGYLVVAVCEYDANNPVQPDGTHGLPHVPLSNVGTYVRSSGIGAVAVCGALPTLELRELAWSLEDSPAQLMFTPRLTDVAGPRIKISDVPGLALVHVDLPRFTGWHHVLKRALDLVLSSVALVLLSPVMAAVAVAIKIGDGGTVIFRQERVGMGGRPFVIHKFRTMTVDAESKVEELIRDAGGQALLFKLEHDPRITRVGHVLRKYSLDELPQFWTVLRGDMSIVGPRPQVAREVAEYTAALHRRLLVKPGITGLWQVNGRSSLSVEESVRLDLHYVENWSLTSDLAVILKTVRVVLRPQDAY